MSVARTITAERERLGISKSELARRADVTRQAVQNWEDGITKPNLTNSAALAAALEIPLQTIVEAARHE